MMLLPSLLLLKSFLVFQRSWWSLLLLAPWCFWLPCYFFLPAVVAFPDVAGVPAGAGDPVVAVDLPLL
jgi:hypothetical protein